MDGAGQVWRELLGSTLWLEVQKFHLTIGFSWGFEICGRNECEWWRNFIGVRNPRNYMARLF